MIPYTSVYERWAPMVARLLLAIQFGAGAFFKVVIFDMQVQASAAVGIPFPTLAVILAFILEVGGIISLLIGWHVRVFSMLLAAYVALLAVLFYHDWAADPMNFGLFMSHLGLIAALLYVSVYGAKHFAIRKD